MAVTDNSYPGPILRLTRGKSNLVWIVAVFLAMRVLASAVGAGVIHQIESNNPDAAEAEHGVYATGEATLPDWGVVSRYLIDPWYRWDTGWYIKIAYAGYANEGTTAFAPLYPFLIRLIQYVTFGNYLLAALIISNIFCLSALILLFDRVLKAFESQDAARQAVVFLLAFPTGFFRLAGYTESLFITLVLATLLLAEERRWLWAGVAGGLAVLTRNQGWAILPAIGWLLVASTPQAEAQESPLAEIRRVWRQVTSWQGWKEIVANLRAGWAAAAIPLLAVIGFPLYLRLSGVKGGVAALTQDWPIDITPPWVTVARAIRLILSGDLSYYGAVHILFLLVTVLLLALAVPKIRPALSVYCLGSLVMILMRDLPTLLDSFPRYALTFLSTFIILGKWGENRWVYRLLLPVFLLLHFWLLFVFISWGWVA